MIRLVLMDLRLAVATDFKDANGNTKFGTVYFIQNCNLSIEPKIYYLMPETNKVEFKELFNEDRIYTFANPQRPKSIWQQTIREWNEEFPPTMKDIETVYEMVSEEKIEFNNK